MILPLFICVLSAHGHFQLFLHATSEICCQKTFGADPSCRVDDRCAELNQVAQDEADRAAAEKATEDHQVGGETQGGGSSNDCSALKWHMSTQTGDVKTCSNSEDFPAAWLDNAPVRSLLCDPSFVYLHARCSSILPLLPRALLVIPACDERSLLSENVWRGPFLSSG